MQYVCSICGYVYDEAQQAIPFVDLPSDWKCPLCGAPKSLFEAAQAPAESTPQAEKSNAPLTEDVEDLTELSAGALSALFSNLARGCEKQYQEEARAAFQTLADFFEDLVPEEEDVDFARLASLIHADMDKNYVDLRSKATAAGDRGALRIVTWGEKVTRMAQSLSDRYLESGDAFLQNTGLYICTVCGFLYVGDEPPALCPVCKVPSWKFQKIEGRATR